MLASFILAPKRPKQRAFLPRNPKVYVESNYVDKIQRPTNITVYVRGAFASFLGVRRKRHPNDDKKRNNLKVALQQ